MRLNFAAKVLLQVLPVVDSSSRFFGSRTKNKKRKLQKKEGALLTFSETVNGSNTSTEHIDSIKERLRSKIQPAAPLILKPSKECDPTLDDNQAELDIDIDIDIGVLSSCDMDQRCVESDMSSLGGVCVDHNIRALKEEKQSRTLQAEYDADYFCSGTNIYFTCDCSGMDENGLGTAVCTYNALPLCVTSTATFKPDNSASIVYCYTTGIWSGNDTYSNVCYTRDLAADGSYNECLMVDNQSCSCSSDIIFECADGYVGTSIDCTGLGVDIQGDDCEGYPYLVPATFYIPDGICSYMTTATATVTPTGSPIDPSPIPEPSTTPEGVIPTIEEGESPTTTSAVVFTATYTPGITAASTDTPEGGDPTASPTDNGSGATGVRHIFVVAALGVWSLGASFWW
jgi:hypothetical protein